jgi:hypothetical protein
MTKQALQRQARQQSVKLAVRASWDFDRPSYPMKT